MKLKKIVTTIILVCIVIGISGCQEKKESDEKGIELPTPISNGGLILAPPGHFSGSARGGISQYHFYWLPPKEGSTTLFRPPAYHFLLVL